MNQLVSIIIPIYNVESYVSQAIKSAIHQTYQKIEIILVDDGSTDNSSNICDSYAREYSNISVIHKKNGGLSDARNAGLKNANGEYVYFLDSDDWIEPYTIETLLTFANENELDVVLFDARVVDENGASYLDSNRYFRYYRQNTYPSRTSGPMMFEEMIKNREYYSSVPLLFIRKNALRIHFEDILHEDELFTIMLLYSIKSVGYYPEQLYVRRIRQGSIMTVPKTKQHYLGMSKVVTNLLHLAEKDSSVVRYACTLLQNTELIYSGLTQEDKKGVRTIRQSLLNDIKSNRYYDSKRLKIVCSLIKLYPLFDKYRNSKYYRSLVLTSHISKIKEYIVNLYKIKTNKEQTIYLLGTPLHGNLGDHAIAISERQYFEEILPEHAVEEINMPMLVHCKKILKHCFKNNDLLVISGGGWLGNQWYHNEVIVEYILNNFSDNKIIILPQTLYFYKNKEFAKQICKARKAFQNTNYLLFLRDRGSCNQADEFFKSKYLYAPDMALRLNLDIPTLKRSGILVCFRDDKERCMNQEERSDIIDKLSSEFGEIKYTTTVVSDVNPDNRVFSVYKKLLEISRAQILITDRLHAMIFAAITCTPCIAFDNSSKKVSGVYDWIKNLKYIKCIGSTNEFSNALIDLQNVRDCKYLQPSYQEMTSEIISFMEH